ncbi:hypothetical protein Lal_00008571 [Lupinus albus]|nr:hypothetical protein Lal_00008571 [Lupinus albus]
MYNKQDAMIHNAPIPSNHLKVSIDISIKDDALMPISVDEDTITIRAVVGTFVAWSEHLIDIVPIMKLSGDSTIVISIPSPVYGFSADEFIGINEVKDKKEEAGYVAGILEKNKENVDLFLAALNIGQHWVLVVINRVSQQMFYFDLLKYGDPNKYPAMKDISSKAFNIYKALNPIRHRSSLSVNWTHVKTPCQNNDKDSGYYVFNFMKELATSLEPKLATLLEPKLATSLEPKLATLLEPKFVTLLEPKFATSLEPKFATSLEPKFATPLEPKSLTNHASPFSLKRENSANFKNSNLTLSLKRGSPHSSENLTASTASKCHFSPKRDNSRSGENTLAQARILMYGSVFHSLRCVTLAQATPFSLKRDSQC